MPIKKCVYRKNPNIVERNIHGTYFLIDITQNYLDNKCRIYENNEMGHFIWETINECDNISFIVNRIKNSLIEPVQDEIIYNDVEEYLSILCSEGFLEIRNGRN